MNYYILNAIMTFFTQSDFILYDIRNIEQVIDIYQYTECAKSL